MLQNHDLRYKIYLPIQNPVPVATLITFNQKVLCEGPPGKTPNFNLKTFNSSFLPYQLGDPMFQQSISTIPSRFNSIPKIRQTL